MLWCLWPHADRGGGGEIAPGATAFRARGSLRCLASGEDFAVRGGAGLGAGTTRHSRSKRSAAADFGPGVNECLHEFTCPYVLRTFVDCKVREFIHEWMFQMTVPHGGAWAATQQTAAVPVGKCGRWLRGTASLEYTNALCSASWPRFRRSNTAGDTGLIHVPTTISLHILCSLLICFTRTWHSLRFI